MPVVKPHGPCDQRHTAPSVITADGAGALLDGREARSKAAQRRRDLATRKSRQDVDPRVPRSLSFTQKPLEPALGKGKAPLAGWVAVIRSLRTFCFEVAVSRKPKRANPCAWRPPIGRIKTTFISRHHHAAELMKVSIRKSRLEDQRAAIVGLGRDMRTKIY